MKVTECFNCPGVQVAWLLHPVFRDMIKTDIETVSAEELEDFNVKFNKSVGHRRHECSQDNPEE